MTLMTPDIIRCYLCGREGLVQGPSGLAEVLGEPGWRIPPSDRYRPSGRHSCPSCIRNASVWFTYCDGDDCCICDEYWNCDDEMECPYCSGSRRRPDAEAPEHCIVAPASWPEKAVLNRAVLEGVESACGNEVSGVVYSGKKNEYFVYGYDFS